MLSVKLKMYIYAGEERYSATMRLEGWLEAFAFPWPFSSHQYSWCFGAAFVIERQTEEKVPWLALSSLIADPSPIWDLFSFAVLLSIPITTCDVAQGQIPFQLFHLP